MISALLLAATLYLPDAAIESAMRDTKTPMLAVAVVQNDKVVYQKTFNSDVDTRFYLASVPKSLTGMAAKSMSHEKKLDIDAPLTTTLPQLKLPAPLDPSRMSIRDLLTHRLGFENDGVGYRASFSGDWTDEQLFTLLEKYSVPTSRQFSYDNLGYMLTSYAIEKASGEPWYPTLRKLVLDPAGMKQTTNEPCIPSKSPRTMNRGSGGLCSTIGDMTRWLRVNMTDGLLDGQRVFPLAVMREAHAAQITLDRGFGRLRRYAYGLGWYHADYQGDLVMHHFGSYPGGAWAHVSWMPERGIGVVVLSNAYNPLPDTVAWLAYDTLLGRADAQKRFDAEVADYRSLLGGGMDAQIAQFEKRLADETPESPRTLASYAGTYENEQVGRIVVQEDGGVLRATLGDRSAILRRARGDAFVVQWIGFEPNKIVFSKDSLQWNSWPPFMKKP